MGFSIVQVEVLVQRDANTKPGLVDLEVAAQPACKERHHLRIAVRERHATIALCALSRIESDAGDEERFVRQLPIRSLPERVRSTICCSFVRRADGVEDVVRTGASRG